MWKVQVYSAPSGMAVLGGPCTKTRTVVWLPTVETVLAVKVLLNAGFSAQSTLGFRLSAVLS